MAWLLPPEAWVFVVVIGIVWMAAQGVKGITGSLTVDHICDRQDIPELRVSSPDGFSRVTIAYYNRAKKRYVARVSCPDLEKHNWVEAKDIPSLKKEIEAWFLSNGKTCRDIDL